MSFGNNLLLHSLNLHIIESKPFVATDDVKYHAYFLLLILADEMFNNDIPMCCVFVTLVQNAVFCAELSSHTS